jgi:DNA-binding MarR family transcriptional regulator
MRVHQAILAVFSREVGVPASRLTILRALANAGPTGIAVTGLARRMGVDAAAVSRQVTDLERDGLVERRADAGDARRSLVALTRRGLRAFEDVHDRAHAFERSLAAVTTTEEIATAARVLAEVRRVLEARR